MNEPLSILPLALLLAALHVAPVRPLDAQAPAVVGQPLSAWKSGWLDIHQISTGKGNSGFLVFPEGTTLLVDAGDAMEGVPESDPHPNGSRTPADFIVRYIKRHTSDSTRGLDYAMLTHLHVDHMGQISGRSSLEPGGAYRLGGITAIGSALSISTMIDRGWPTYDYPAPVTDSVVANYRRFLATRAASGMQIERFRVGARSQIVMRREATRYAECKVRNIVGNGAVWTGTGETSRESFPPVASLSAPDIPSENMCSLGVRISYGRFRYFTGGDLQGTADPGFPAWHSVEASIAQAIGPVDAHVVNHHGSMGAESDVWIKTLASTVYVIPSWAPSHPAPDVLKRLVNSRYAPTERYLYATELRASARTVIGARANTLSQSTGHVIIRVEPGGAQYWVIVTSISDERDIVTAVRGPLQSQVRDARVGNGAPFGK